jgi:quaternary ammonium compound-resistance protein SugE
MGTDQGKTANLLGIALLGEAASLGRVASIALIVVGIMGLKLATPT